MNKYIGHDSQVFGVEEYRLIGGKGDGMRLLQVKNGLGLEFTVSLDRCADISRLSFLSYNYGYFSPCGYVSPKYYDNSGVGFLKSFTAGFLTTCGLTAVGAPCIDNGEVLPLHGTISNTPSENVNYWTEDDIIHIKAEVRQASLFSEKLLLTREYSCSIKENKLTISDRVKNIGSSESPLMLLYHFNMGYPLLSEKSTLIIPTKKVTPRDDHAAKDADKFMNIIPPQRGFQEQCYYHQLKNKNGNTYAGIFNPAIEKGVIIKFNVNELDSFTQWKMMGESDYVLGLEPGNCTPDGRDVMRKEGKLKFIKPDEEYYYHIELEIIENAEKYNLIRKEN